MKSHPQRILAMLAIAALAALAANMLHPRRIPWVQDWSAQVEAKARAKGIQPIPLAVALQMYRDGAALFVDARSPDEFAKGRIAGAVSLPARTAGDAFERAGAWVDSGRQLVVYCDNRECDDALVLATELQAMGCTNALLYIDGFEAWKKNNLPVEAGQ